MTKIFVQDVISILQDLYPAHTSEGWDQVGLSVGSPSQQVSKVLFAVDATPAVITEAIATSADLIVTHHPLLMRGIHAVNPESNKGWIITQLIKHDIALFTAHTNADIARFGVCEALAEILNLQDVTPLVPRVEEVSIGHGRVGTLAADITLHDFAQLVARRLPATHHGVRVSGDLQAEVRRIAVLGGAGDSFFNEVRAAQADVYVTADLRHHPVLEARELAELGGGTPAFVDVAHWASEWPWLNKVRDQVQARLEAQGHRDIGTAVSTIVTDPWSAHIPSTPPPAPNVDTEIG